MLEESPMELAKRAGNELLLKPCKQSYQVNGRNGSAMSRTLKSAAYRLELEIRICRLVLKDGRASRLAKWLLGLALAYALSPINLISDLIPFLGQLDDLIIVPALLILTLKLIPKEVIEDCRAQTMMTDRTIPSRAFNR
jgi:uncharacterized membrane protein YkvA (DUF1232 family)